MAFTWRNAGLNYLQYCNIAAKALRRALKDEPAAIASKRDQMSLKFANWTSGKHPEPKPLTSLNIKPKAQ